jgi:hypothetical protein
VTATKLPQGPCGFAMPGNNGAPSAAASVWNVLARTANVVGGGGQVLAGVALCDTLVACIGGAPLAALGASNIQEGFSGSPGFVRSGATSIVGPTAGNLLVDGTNIAFSGGSLIIGVVKPGTFSLFRNISSDFVPAYQVMTNTGLATNVGSSLFSAADTVLSYNCNGM